MKVAADSNIIEGGMVIVGRGDPPIANGTVIVEDGRITYAGTAVGAPEAPEDAQKIDASGTTVMPGLVEAHWHASYFNISVLEDLDIAHPAEMVAIHAAFNARLALECGYTAARSAGCLFNIDVALAAGIDSDLVPGPRFVPSGQEICGAGGLMDWNPDFRKIGMEGVILVVDGPDQARSAARRLVKNGAEWLKTYPTGDAAAPGTNDQHTLSMTYEEMEAVVQVAHNHRRKVFGHCRATAGIKNALVAGFDSIEHGTFMDTECLDLMLEREVPCVPALQFELASITHGPEFGMPQDVVDGHQETLEGGAESARMIHQAGGLLGMGGDYGFAWNPHGDYAKELSFFTDYVGLSTLDTLVCASRNGAEIMGISDEIGTLEADKLADLLIVDGDVAADISLLEHRSNLRAVMQGGIIKAGTMATLTPTVVPPPE
jgi:imidazolonepropionase-like amidohydrolase